MSVDVACITKYGMRMVQNVVDHCIMNVAVCTRPCLPLITDMLLFLFGASARGEEMDGYVWSADFNTTWLVLAQRSSSLFPASSGLHASTKFLSGDRTVRTGFGPRTGVTKQADATAATLSTPLQTGSALPSSSHLVRAEQAAMADVVLMW